MSETKLRRLILDEDEDFPDDLMEVIPFAIFRRDEGQIEVWYLEEVESNE
jgi:hypothetical protein